MITLQEVIAKHQNLLGTNFEHLGKKNQIYLSYDQTTGWSVQKFDGCFGFIKQIFRWLGFYASTHFLHVAGQLHKETNVPIELKMKINDCVNRNIKGDGRKWLFGYQPGELPLVEEPRSRFVPDPNIPNRFGLYIGDTHISIQQGDITWVAGVSAIVNAANETCLGGGGIDGAIHRAAGPQLLEECQKLPQIRPNVRCETGHAVITEAGLLAVRVQDGPPPRNLNYNVDRIIHAVGPRYDAANPAGSAALLKATYINSLNLAHANGIRTIAFPAISTGIFGYDFDAATRIAMETVEEYAVQNPGRFDEIKLIFWQDLYDRARAVFDGFQHQGVRENLIA